MVIFFLLLPLSVIISWNIFYYTLAVRMYGPIKKRNKNIDETNFQVSVQINVKINWIFKRIV